MPQQVVRVVLKGRLFNVVETRNIFYYGSDRTEPADQNTFGIFADRIQEIAQILKPLLTNKMQFYEISAEAQVGNNWLPIGTRLISEQGLVDGDMTSFQTAAYAFARTGVRRAVGKKYFAGVAEAMTENGRISWLGLFPLVGACVKWLQPIHVGLENWYPGIVSINAAFAPFISLSLPDVLSTMRRRKPGYGI